jgi:hypothetical protein
MKNPHFGQYKNRGNVNKKNKNKEEILEKHRSR